MLYPTELRAHVSQVLGTEWNRTPTWHQGLSTQNSDFCSLRE